MRRFLETYILKILTWSSALLTFGALFFLIINIFFNGLSYLTPSLFSFTYTTENVSLFPALITTFLVVCLSLFLAVPIGIFTAIYLVEYAKSNNKLVLLIRLTAETLAGIPSIIYGLFGLLFFVTWLKWGPSLLAGTFTMSIMILPLIIRTTEESLRGVPQSFREGSFALGAGKLRTIFRIVLPAATPGILAGIILSVGRIIGETAALIYTSGTVAQIPEGLFSSGRTLAVHMYALSSEGLYTGQAYGTAVILLLVVVMMNTLAKVAAKKMMGGRTNG